MLHIRFFFLKCLRSLKTKLNVCVNTYQDRYNQAQYAAKEFWIACGLESAVCFPWLIELNNIHTHTCICGKKKHVII